MKLLRHIACTGALFTTFSASAMLSQPGPKDACVAMDDKSCDVSDVHAFSAVDLNADGEKEIVFAWSGGFLWRTALGVHAQKGKMGTNRQLVWDRRWCVFSS